MLKILGAVIVTMALTMLLVRKENRIEGITRLVPVGQPIYETSNMTEVPTGGYVLWTWPYDDMRNLNLEMDMLSLVPVAMHADHSEFARFLMRKTDSNNLSIEAFRRDRKNPDYERRTLPTDTYCIFMDKWDETILATIATLDLSRDVNVFLLFSDNVTYAQDKLERKKVLAHVRNRLPRGENVVYAWNLRYNRVSTILEKGVFDHCNDFCARNDRRSYGGYFGPGFVMHPNVFDAEQMLRTLWKPNAPYRRNGFRDVMNEVYMNRWISL
jgi:hypothetical protein